MKLGKWIAAVLLFTTISSSAQLKTENIVIVTLDGMRWQEVFGGADAMILKDKKYTRDSSGTSKDFWIADAAVRRKKIFPFLWSTVATEGQLYVSVALV